MLNDFCFFFGFCFWCAWNACQLRSRERLRCSMKKKGTRDGNNFFFFFFSFCVFAYAIRQANRIMKSMPKSWKQREIKKKKIEFRHLWMAWHGEKKKRSQFSTFNFSSYNCKMQFNCCCCAVLAGRQFIGASNIGLYSETQENGFCEQRKQVAGCTMHTIKLQVILRRCCVGTERSERKRK